MLQLNLLIQSFEDYTALLVNFVAYPLLHTDKLIYCNMPTDKPWPCLSIVFRRVVFDHLHLASHPSIRYSGKLVTDRFVLFSLAKGIQSCRTRYQRVVLNSLELAFPAMVSFVRKCVRKETRDLLRKILHIFLPFKFTQFLFFNARSFRAKKVTLINLLTPELEGHDPCQKHSLMYLGKRMKTPKSWKNDWPRWYQRRQSPSSWLHCPASSSRRQTFHYKTSPWLTDSLINFSLNQAVLSRISRMI